MHPHGRHFDQRDSQEHSNTQLMKTNFPRSAKSTHLKKEKRIRHWVHTNQNWIISLDYWIFTRFFL